MASACDEGRARGPERRMFGGLAFMVSATDEAMADDEARTAPMRLALAHVETLPPK